MRSYFFSFLAAAGRPVVHTDKCRRTPVAAPNANDHAGRVNQGKEYDACIGLCSHLDGCDDDEITYVRTHKDHDDEN